MDLELIDRVFDTNLRGPYVLSIEHAKRLIAENGVSALWATHIMDEIQPDDDLVILHEGQVLRRDRASEIARGKGLTQAFLDLTGVEPA